MVRLFYYIFSKIIVLFIGIFFSAASFEAFAKQMNAMDSGYPFDIPAKLPLRPDHAPRSHFMVDGLDDETQFWVNHAVDNMHGFWIYEAERKLRYVISKQTFSPMLHVLAAWNHKMFNSGDFERGRTYLDRAKFLAKQSKLSPRENLYLLAVDALYKDVGREQRPVPLEHLQYLGEIMSTYPEDAEAHFFWSLGAWLNLEYEEERKNIAEDKAKEIRYQIQNILDAFLEKNPMHPAHHYKIHLWNNGKDEFNALSSARKIAPANFEMAHLWHMPAHIFNRTRDYAYAIRHTEIAHRVDHKYLEENQIQATQIHNYVHNYRDFALELNAKSGRPKYAIERAISILKKPRLIHQSSRVSHQRLARKILSVLENHKLWDEFLELELHSTFRFLETGLREMDAEFLSELDRTKLLACLEIEDVNQRYSCDLQSLLKQLSDRASGDVDSSRLSLLSEDAHLHYEIKQKEIAKQLAPSAYLSKLLSLQITPAHEIMLLSYLHNQRGLLKILLENSMQKNEDEMDPVEESNVLSMLIQNPELLEKYSKEAHQKIVSHKSQKLSFSLAESFERDFLSKNYIGIHHSDFLMENIFQPAEKRTTEESFKVAPDYTYLYEKDLDVFGSRDSNLGLLGLEGMDQETRNKILPPKDRFKLIIFIVGMGCPLCDIQIKQILDNIALWEQIGVEPLFITQVALDKSFEASIPDEDFLLHKKFGAFDEIDAIPLHGVMLIDSNQQLRFKSVGLHPIADVGELFLEISRLVQ